MPPTGTEYCRPGLKFIISEDGTATLFSLDQGGKPIRGNIGAERVEMEFPSLGGNFFGRLVAADRIDGLWLQSGRDFPLALERGEAAIADPSPRASPDESLGGLQGKIAFSTGLETERLIFREVQASDVGAFEKYMLSDHYLRHMPMEPTTMRKAVDVVARVVAFHLVSLAAGGIAPVPLRQSAAELAAQGAAVTPSTIAAAARAAMDGAKPLPMTRYKLGLLEGLVLDLLEQCSI